MFDIIKPQQIEHTFGVINMSGTYQHSIKRTRKLRWGRVFILLACICFCLSFTVTALGENVSKVQVVEQVIVKEGDTLWGLIQSHNPEFTGNMNKAIYEVEVLNQLENATLQPGQQLKIPITL